jgi:hypothetical protein
MIALYLLSLLLPTAALAALSSARLVPARVRRRRRSERN